MDKKQFDELVVKAAAGDAVALCKVGETYRHGNNKLGVVLDEKKGWELIERAKSAGSFVARYLTGKKEAKSSGSWVSRSGREEIDKALSSIQSADCIEFAEFELMNIADWMSPSLRKVKIQSALIWYRKAIKFGASESELEDRISRCLTELGVKDGGEPPEVVIGDKKTVIRDSAFFLDITLEDITIADGVEEIGLHAFSGCKSLRSVKFPASLRKIGLEAFLDCPNLTSVSFSEGLKTIGDAAFKKCQALREVRLPTTVTGIGLGVFEGCSSLERASFSNRIKRISANVLRDCKSLKQVDIPEGVRHIGPGAFAGCRSIERIELPSTVKSLGGEPYWLETGGAVFEDCSSLVDINIPPLVTQLGFHVFYGCSALEEIEVPRHVVEIYDSAFENCKRLKSVTFHEGLTHLRRNAFRSCLSLSEVVLPQSVVELGMGCFENCTSLERFSAPDQAVKHGSGVFNGCLKLPEIIIDGTLIHSSDTVGDVVITSGVSKIGPALFRGCQEMTSVKIPDTVTAIGQGAFERCGSLKDISIPGSVESIGSAAFKGCSSLESVEIPNSVMNIDNWTFEGCSGLKSITIPEGVKSIEHQVFKGCKSLENVEIPASVQKIGSFVFDKCGALRKVIIQYGALKDCRNPNEGCYIFNECPNIEHIVLPCYLEHRLRDWFGKKRLQKITILSDSDTVVAERTTADQAALDKKRVSDEKRKNILAKVDDILWDINKDVSEGKTIQVSALSARAQKLALASGLLLTDIVTYRHEYSYVLHCPCTMQFPALERVSVKVPRSMLSDGEPDYYLVYLDQDREKSWLVLPTEETELPGGGVEVYDSASEAKASRFGALFAVISSARSVGKK